MASHLLVMFKLLLWIKGACYAQRGLRAEMIQTPGPLCITSAGANSAVHRLWHDEGRRVHRPSAEKTRLSAHSLPHNFLEEAEETRSNRGQNLSVDCPIRGR